MVSDVLVVVPAYNEQDSIHEVLTGLRRSVPGFDLVVVDDGSDDDTAAVAQRLGVRTIRLPCNVGYGGALQVGIRYALARQYDVVVFFDADGQHDPEAALLLVETLRREGADLVIGARFGADRPYVGSLARRLTQIAFSTMTRPLVGRRIYDTTSGLKALTARACRDLVSGNLLDFHMEALVRLGVLQYSIVEVPVKVRPRDRGTSMYTGLRALGYPIATLLLTLVALVDALLERRSR